MVIKTIRIADANDAYQIAAIHVASWQKIYRGHVPDTTLNNLSVDGRAAEWLWLIENHVKILVIELDGVMVGFACLGLSRDTDADPTKCGEISALYFHPDYWRQGLGGELCDRAFAELKEMGLVEVKVWVLKTNALARRFYEKMGFEETSDVKTDNYDKDVILEEVRYRMGL